MFDEKMLDRMNFGELRQSLDYVLERIDEIEDDLSDDEDDPRLDALYTTGNHITTRMDAIVREYGRQHPEALAQWNPVMREYEESYDKYTDIILEDDILLDEE